MKKIILLSLIFFGTVYFAKGQEVRELELLEPTKNFKLDSLNKVIKTVPELSGFIYVEVWTRPNTDSLQHQEKEFYFLKLLTITQESFNHDIYKFKDIFGCFEFENNVILVRGYRGDTGVMYFFKKTGKQRRFSVPIYNDKPHGITIFDYDSDLHVLAGYSVSDGKYKLEIFRKNFHFVY